MTETTVKFRRGGSELPEAVTDGYITFNTDNGAMYVDAGNKRLAVKSNLFGTIHNDPEEQTEYKVAVIPGVPAYFDGLTITVAFDYIYSESYTDVYVSIQYGETSLESVQLYKADGSVVKEMDLIAGAPYTMTYCDGKFYMVGSASSGGTGNVEWMELN